MAGPVLDSLADTLVPVQRESGSKTKVTEALPELDVDTRTSGMFKGANVAEFHKTTNEE